MGLLTNDRRQHVYIVGKSGTGKTTLLKKCILSDVSAEGIGIIDPHGDLAEWVLNNVPRGRTNDVVVFDPADHPVPLNLLEHPDRSLAVSGILAVFSRMWPDVWSGRMEHILRNTLLALAEAGGQTIAGVMRMYVDPKFRRDILSRVADTEVLGFWHGEFDKWTERYRVEALAAVQNKVGQLLTSPIVRGIVSSTKSRLEVRKIMDNGQILIANLSKGRLGEDVAKFLGSLLVTKFQLDAMQRADTPEDQRKDFFLYVDEFQNFVTESFASILSEARKYRLNLTLANQYIGQLSIEGQPVLRDAIFGNAGTIISFQVGADDAEYLAAQFGDEELATGFLNLPRFHAYVRLLVDGMTTQPFSIVTMPPETTGHSGEKVKRVSRERYGVK